MPSLFLNVDRESRCTEHRVGKGLLIKRWISVCQFAFWLDVDNAVRSRDALVLRHAIPFRKRNALTGLRRFALCRRTVALSAPSLKIFTDKVNSMLLKTVSCKSVHSVPSESAKASWGQSPSCYARNVHIPAPELACMWHNNRLGFPRLPGGDDIFQSRCQHDQLPKCRVEIGHIFHQPPPYHAR